VHRDHETITGDWTAKDLFGHITSWNREFRACIRAIRQGEHPGLQRCISGDNDFEQWNEHWIAEKRGWSWSRMRADLDRDYQEAVKLIVALEPCELRKRGITPWQRAAENRPAGPLTDEIESVETLISYHWRHMNQHARMIERWSRQRA
jgi:hypothetical protein